MSRRILGLVLLGVVTLGGCGVRPEGQPRDIDPPPGRNPVPVTTAPTEAETGSAAEPLYFVRGDRLVAVIRRIRTAPTVQQQVRHLLDGPTEAERGAGLSSTLTGNLAVTGVTVSGGTAVVQVGDYGQDSGRLDDVLAFGQIVCTLTARPEVGAVVFRSGGRPLGVPRGDGSLSDAGLTAADYAALTAPA